MAFNRDYQEQSRFPISFRGGCLGVAAVLFAIGVFLAWWNIFDRVDPGNAGVIVNYCDRTQRVVPTAGYVRLNPLCERLAEYAISERTMFMTATSGPAAKDGTPGNDSTRCIFKDQQKMTVDSASTWEIMIDRVGDLYMKRPGVPLSGSDNSIEMLIVRTEIRAGILQTCTEFMWEEVYGAKRNDFESAAQTKIFERLEPLGIKLNNFAVRDVDPAPELDQLLTNRLNGQQTTEAAKFKAEQAVREGEANLATQKATAALDAEKSTAALAKAKADAAQAEATALGLAAKTRAEADAQAYKIGKEAEATAKANKAIAESITKDFIEYTRWKQWNGQGPTTVFGGDAQPRIDVPIPAR